MAIHIHNKDITEVYAHNKAISAIYKGAVLVWEAVRSCFGSGMWISKKPWLGKEGWKEGKKYN